MTLFVYRVAAELVLAEMIMEFPTEPMSYFVARNGQHRCGSFTAASPKTEFRVGSAVLCREAEIYLRRALSSRSTVRFDDLGWTEKSNSSAGAEAGPNVTPSILRALL